LLGFGFVFFSGDHIETDVRRCHDCNIAWKCTKECEKRHWKSHRLIIARNELAFRNSPQRKAQRERSKYWSPQQSPVKKAAQKPFNTPPRQIRKRTTPLPWSAERMAVQIIHT